MSFVFCLWLYLQCYTFLLQITKVWFVFWNILRLDSWPLLAFKTSVISISKFCRHWSSKFLWRCERLSKLLIQRCTLLLTARTIATRTYILQSLSYIHRQTYILRKFYTYVYSVYIQGLYCIHNLHVNMFAPVHNSRSDVEIKNQLIIIRKNSIACKKLAKQIDTIIQSI